MSKNAKGILWMIVSSLCLATFASIVKFLSQDLSIYIITAILSFMAFPMLMPWFLKKGVWFPKTKHIKLYTARSILGMASLLLWASAVSVAPIPYLTAVYFTLPLFTVLLAIIFFKEQHYIGRTTALIVGFVGVLVVIRPFTEEFHYAAIFVLLAAFLRGGVNLMVKKLSSEDSASTLLFHTSFIFFLLYIPLLIVFWDMPDGIEWLWLIVLAAISNLYIVAMYYAYIDTDLTLVMPFDFTQLIFASVISYFIFSELVDFWTIVGSIVIIASAVYAVRRERKVTII